MMPGTPEQATSQRITRRAWRGIGALVLLLITLAVVVAYLAEREPQYQGRSLSSWLADLDRSKPAPVRAAAQLAVHQIGTNALPTLRRWMVAKEEGKQGGIRKRIAAWLTSRSGGRLNWFPPDRRWLAARAYETLGTLAEPAVPELIASLRDEASRDQAAFALAGIGSPSVGPLISCLSSEDAEVHRLATTALGAIGAQPERCVAALLDRVGQTNQFDALRSLGEFGDAAVVALPQLESALTNSESGWFDASYALAQLGEDGLLPLMRGMVSTNSNARRASAAGLVWHDSLPRVRGLGGESRMGSFLGRMSAFNTMSMQLSVRFYSSGEAAPLAPLVAPYVQSSDPRVREAAAAVTNRLAQLPPHEKMPVTQPHLPGGSNDE